MARVGAPESGLTHTDSEEAPVVENLTRLCELLVGLGAVEVLGVEDAPVGALVLHVRTRRWPACGDCGGAVWSPLPQTPGEVHRSVQFPGSGVWCAGLGACCGGEVLDRCADALFGDDEVELGLEVRPVLGLDAESVSESRGGVGARGSFAGDDLSGAVGPHVGSARELGGRHTQLLQLLLEDPPGMHSAHEDGHGLLARGSSQSRLAGA